MRDTERYLEKKRKNEGGSNGENLRELEKKRNCPFDAKKVCPVTKYFFGTIFFGCASIFSGQPRKPHKYSVSACLTHIIFARKIKKSAP